MKSMIFWAVMLCSSAEVHTTVSEECTTSILLSLLFNPENDGNVFLQNISGLLQNRIVLQPGRSESAMLL
jgi:hypothetical protein